MSQPRDQLSVYLGADNLYSELKQIGVKHLAITLKIRLWEVNDGYQHILLYNNSDTTVLWETKLNHEGNSTGKTPTVYDFRIYIPIDDIYDENFLKIRYSASGSFSDTWKTDILYCETMYVVNQSDIYSPDFTWDNEDPFQ